MPGLSSQQNSEEMSTLSSWQQDSLVVILLLQLFLGLGTAATIRLTQKLGQGENKGSKTMARLTLTIAGEKFLFPVALNIKKPLSFNVLKQLRIFFYPAEVTHGDNSPPLVVFLCGDPLLETIALKTNQKSFCVWACQNFLNCGDRKIGQPQKLGLMCLDHS